MQLDNSEFYTEQRTDKTIFDLFDKILFAKAKFYASYGVNPNVIVLNTKYKQLLQKTRLCDFSSEVKCEDKKLLGLFVFFADSINDFALGFLIFKF